MRIYHIFMYKIKEVNGIECNLSRNVMCIYNTTIFVCTNKIYSYSEKLYLKKKNKKTIKLNSSSEIKDTSNIQIFKFAVLNISL